MLWLSTPVSPSDFSRGEPALWLTISFPQSGGLRLQFRVWDVFSHPDRWPEWWGSLERIVEIRKGDLRGIGALHRYTWKGALPYRLTFDINVLKIRPCTLLEGQASGTVEGRGMVFYCQWYGNYCQI